MHFRKKINGALQYVSLYESVGRGFESLSPYQETRYPNGYLVFCFSVEEDSNKEIHPASGRVGIAGWTAMRPYPVPVAQGQRIPFAMAQMENR